MYKWQLDIARDNLFELLGFRFTILNDIGLSTVLHNDDYVIDLLNKNKISYVIIGKILSIDIWDAYNYKSNLREDKINSILG